MATRKCEMGMEMDLVMAMDLLVGAFWLLQVPHGNDRMMMTISFSIGT